MPTRTSEADASDCRSSHVDTRAPRPHTWTTVLPSGSSTRASTSATYVGPKLPTRSITMRPVSADASTTLMRATIARRTAGTSMCARRPPVIAATNTRVVPSHFASARTAPGT